MPSTDLPDAFYLPDGDGFVATELTRGPWHNDFQHGGPPAALLARALDAPGFFLARLSVALLRPVPIGRLTVEVEPVRGRTAQRPVARLVAGDTVVAEARGLRIRRLPLDLPAPPEDPAWPDADSLPPYAFTFFRHEVAYHRAIELRVAYGRWGATPVGFWARLRVPLVSGTATSAFEQVTVLADAQSGMGLPLDLEHFTFVNPDLTIYLEREPEPGWVGFDIRSVAGPQGSGLAQSALRDARGVMGRSAQALVVQPASSP